MIPNTIKKFQGKYCKIVTKEAWESRAHATTGVIKGVDRRGQVFCKTSWGTMSFDVRTIVAIRPQTQVTQ